MDKSALENTAEFQPRFNQDGLIPCIATAYDDGEVLMFAWMNAEALRLSLETGLAHYWSRSRQSLWKKGETSGHVQKVKEMHIDCDQDCLWIVVESGPACHTGRRSCFYRVVEDSKSLVFRE